MSTRKLLMVAAFIATTVSSSFAGWSFYETIEEVCKSNSSGDVYFVLSNQKAWINGQYKNKMFLIRKQDGVSEEAQQAQLDMIMSAIEAGKRVKVSYNDSQVNYYNNPGYKVGTVCIEK